MVEQFQISIFQPPQQMFYPGSVLRGKLTVEAWEPKEYRYIRVSLIGEAHTSVKQPDDDEDDYSPSEPEIASQKYVHMHVFVWNCEQTRDGRLQSGRHNFPFQFTIPIQRLPSSFQGRNSYSSGYIQYYVEGRIGTGQPNCDRITTAVFPLVEVVDINAPEFQRPTGGEVQKTLGRWFCASGPITVTAESPRTGFYIGEIIPLTVRVDNASDKQIKVDVYLKQQITYRAENKQYSSHKTLLHVTSGTVPTRNTAW